MNSDLNTDINRSIDLQMNDNVNTSMKSNLNVQLGYLALMLAQISLAINFVIGKLIASHFPIMSLLFLRFFIAFILIAIYLCCSSAFRAALLELKNLSSRDWCLLILQAIGSGFLFNFLTLYGLQYTTATAAGTINSTIPAFIVIFSVLLLNEKLNLRKLLAITCTVIGIGLISMGKVTEYSFKTNELYGLFFIFLALIPGSLFSIFAKMMKTTLNPLTTTAFISYLNLFLFLPFALGDEWYSFYNASWLNILEILLYCITGGVLFFFFWFKGLARTTANTAALFIGITPVATSIFAYCFLSESLSWFDILGIFAIIFSIVFGVFNSNRLHTYQKTLSKKIDMSV